MADVRIQLQQSPDTKLVDNLVGRLVASNDRVAPPENYKRLAAFAIDDGGDLVGGVLGYTHWGWLFVSHLWVNEGHRSEGLGTQLMNTIERVAVDRGAQAGHLDTYDFQALPFYQKRGYEVFGKLDDYPNGHTRYFLRRALLPGDPLLPAPIGATPAPPQPTTARRGRRRADR